MFKGHLLRTNSACLIQFYSIGPKILNSTLQQIGNLHHGILNQG